jgi:transposase-like protein
MARAKPDAGDASRARWTEADARAALNALAASGLTVKEFATQAGLEKDRLYRWRHRLGVVGSMYGKRRAPAQPRARSRTSSALIEIEPPRHTGQIELVLRSGITLRVAETIDPGTLARLVDALARSD